MTSAPTNLDSLLRRLHNFATETHQPFGVVQRTLANVVISQLLPAGVVRGGTAMRIRAGVHARFSTDIDAVRAEDLDIDEYVDQLRHNLERGWQGFHGVVEALEAFAPSNVPDEYVMRPFRIRLSYIDRPWLNLLFELGHDEIGAAEVPELCMSDDITAMFGTLGLSRPSPVPLLAVEHQIAQKLHACTAPTMPPKSNERVHDLVDLQLLLQVSAVDFAKARRACTRLFKARREHAWPPTVCLMSGWTASYETAAEGLEVLRDAEAAVGWVNDLVTRIESER